MVVAMGFVLLAPVLAHAELTLWLKYYYAAEEALEKGQFTRAEALFRAAERESKITLPPSNFRLASTLDGLGRVYLATGRHDEADDHLNRALAMKKETLGPHTREVPRTVVSLADLRFAQGRLDEVERLYRHALLILVRDQTDVGVTRSMNGLAMLYLNRGDLLEAESLLERARNIHLDARRRNHPEMAATLDGLGRVYAAQGRLEAAIAVFEQAATIRVKTLGNAHPALADTLEQWAASLRRLGRANDAADLEDRAAQVRSEHTRVNEFYSAMGSAAAG